MKFMTRFSDLWIYWENRVWLTNKESQSLLSKSWETVSTVQSGPVPGSMGTRQIRSKHIQERSDSGKEPCSLAKWGWGDTVLSNRLWGVNSANISPLVLVWKQSSSMKSRQTLFLDIFWGFKWGDTIISVNSKYSFAGRGQLARFTDIFPCKKREPYRASNQGVTFNNKTHVKTLSMLASICCSH